MNNLPINWFDFIAVILVLVGVHLGGKRGMSKELITFLQWGIIIIAAAIVHPVLGELVHSFAGLSAATSAIIGYLFVAAVVKLIFMFINNKVGESIETKHVFGRMEYHLGPLAGGVKFTCIILLTMALLHPWTQTEEQRKIAVKYQKDNYGSVYFPTLGIVNDEIFNKSFSGRWISENLSFLLISSSSVTPPARQARS